MVDTYTDRNNNVQDVRVNLTRIFEDLDAKTSATQKAKEIIQD